MEGPTATSAKKNHLFIACPDIVTDRADGPPDDRQMAPGPYLRWTLFSGNPDVRRLTKGGVTFRASWAPDNRWIMDFQIDGPH